MRIITTHKNTDFDALASVIAANILYPDAVPVLPTSINPNVKDFLSIHKDIFDVRFPDEIDLENIDCLIVVDVNLWSRLDRIDRLRHRDDIEIFMWDHHPIIGDINPDWKCHEDMGAAITLMIRCLKGEKKVLTPMQATLFLIGLYEDTGCLTFPSTHAEDAHAAAYLLEQKADLEIVNTFLRPAYGQRHRDILFEMLKTAKRTKINGYNISINRIKIEGHLENLAVVVNMYREILNVDAAFGIFINGERCMVIGRSNNETLNVGMIMRSLGGGGHPRAASSVLKSVNPDAVEETITSLIQGNQQTSVQISDLMSYPVFTVTPEMSMDEVNRLLKEKGCTGFPVVEDDHIIGIISRRDFRKVKKRSAMKAPVKAFMKRNVITVEPGKSPIQAARLMVKHDIGRLPVVEDGRLIGIVTRSDAMAYFYDLLPDQIP